ncbi:SDR family NAD(P)-dependent oxidoreductase [Futiania mangrovi]|uniref:SDR family oxidoreductase n=1 Tax=Futiania mangrovi TaxID=2959716 RepID=A0A9J6PD12_9PROT|nr:SDR family oxidoreductase [Futiania mangrovii]MCP1337253.1 SDR family oxidoreductase [Futiania mangrovii]
MSGSAGSLDGRVAVVTGGASGIGAACARLLAARGARLVVADMNEAGAEAVARETGGTAMHLDVCDEASIEAVAARTEAEVGPAEILVTSAGIVQPPLPPEELPMELFDRVVAVNLRGTYLSARAFAQHMLPRRKGAIVTISSITAERATPLHAYAPTKAAVTNLTAGLAAEWGRAGIRVNTIEPGYTRTPALQDQIDRGYRDPTLLEENSALGRLVEPDEIARAAAFLVSDEAAAITGIALPVDCGYFTAGGWAPYGGVRKRGG